ncbi:hypothetical protein [Streptomyces sp. STR69]|uniref:hypothetical protein n=1 Tax=Streptomyces sp. STR69 TaxID=1796942 RepID=UPI0021C82EC5|nr:hypothetical protein [Streptomyces sp. STR69]
MRARPDVGRKRIDLSVPHVAGSALAAVVAAKLASYFGVYGTILGAGVVSAIATSGGSVLQHLLSRTGATLREATVTSKEPEQPPARPGEFTEGTVYRARVGSWKRPVLAAALVFGVTMTGITGYELVSGDSFSGGKGTTVSAAVTGHETSPSPKSGDSGGEPGPADSPSGSSAAPETPSTGNGGGTSSSPTPTPSASEEAATPTPAPSASATDPAPSASSRSGTADQDPADPAAP